MLKIPTYLASSPIAGIGLFAGIDIPRGTVIWAFDERVDSRLTAEEIDALPEPFRSHVLRYAYREEGSGAYILCGDNCRFMNHAPEPNTCEPPGPDTLTARDIKAGEELTGDYRVFDSRWRVELPFEVVASKGPTP